MRPIYNVPYAPQYNPIEGCFSVVKNHFKRARLNALARSLPFGSPRAVRQAFNQLNVKNVRGHVKRSLAALKVEDAAPAYEVKTKTK